LELAIEAMFWELGVCVERWSFEDIARSRRILSDFMMQKPVPGTIGSQFSFARVNSSPEQRSAHGSPFKGESS
jgi:hypothetical protein